MNISILTLFPELYTPFVATSLIGRAQEKGVMAIETVNFFSFCAPKERLDAPTYGPGAGMVLKPLIVEQAIAAQDKKYGAAYKIFFSPHGKKVDQHVLKDLARLAQEKQHVMFVCARYEGMDARVEEEYADAILSIGDYVLMGGDVPAMVVLEGMLRYVPGVVGKDESVASDSFTGPLVDYPEYTEPLEWHGKQVPEIIRSGNHEKIATWRREQAIGRTLLHHFDWLRSWVLAPKLKQEILVEMPPHYVVLMHDEVQLKDGRIGTSSVTSIDIHDIARSAATYGFKRFFLLTPLEDQTKIVQTLLDFWLNRGQNYNGNRSQAVQLVALVKKLDEVVEAIERETRKKPLLIATSAREHEQAKTICYNDQELIWQQQRPVLLVFGTASGLADQVLQRCDYVLAPVYGLAEFNHLSVRSAAAVVFDRWLGLQVCKRGLAD